jgi:hypothetical protein
MKLAVLKAVLGNDYGAVEKALNGASAIQAEADQAGASFKATQPAPEATTTVGEDDGDDDLAKTFVGDLTIEQFSTLMQTLNGPKMEPEKALAALAGETQKSFEPMIASFKAITDYMDKLTARVTELEAGKPGVPSAASLSPATTIKQGADVANAGGASGYMSLADFWAHGNVGGAAVE